MAGGAAPRGPLCRQGPCPRSAFLVVQGLKGDAQQAPAQVDIDTR
jgi:hypothetical protein